MEAKANINLFWCIPNKNLIKKQNKNVSKFYTFDHYV